MKLEDLINELFIENAKLDLKIKEKETTLKNKLVNDIITIVNNNFISVLNTTKKIISPVCYLYLGENIKLKINLNYPIEWTSNFHLYGIESVCRVEYEVGMSVYNLLSKKDLFMLSIEKLETIKNNLLGELTSKLIQDITNKINKYKKQIKLKKQFLEA